MRGDMLFDPGRALRLVELAVPDVRRVLREGAREGCDSSSGAGARSPCRALFIGRCAIDRVRIASLVCAGRRE